MSYDQAVRDWYVVAERFVPMQDPTLKAIDHRLLDAVGIEDRDVLDVGCFYPETEQRYAARAKSWVATDFIPEVIERSRALQEWPSTVRFDVADMRHLPYADASFDVVTDFSSGDHLGLEDWGRAVAEIRRVLRPSGYFVCTYANRNFFGGADGCVGDYGYERYTFPATMREILHVAGFYSTTIPESTGHARSGIVVQR